MAEQFVLLAAIRLPVWVRQAGCWVTAAVDAFCFTPEVLVVQAARLSIAAIAPAVRSLVVINTSKSCRILLEGECERSFAVDGDRGVELRLWVCWRTVTMILTCYRGKSVC
jgi:hypothetical protein